MKKKLLVLMLIVSFISILLTACHEKSIEKIYGQELVKCSAIYNTDSELSYELPIICENEIRDFSIEEYVINGNGQYEINFVYKMARYAYSNVPLYMRIAEQLE